MSDELREILEKDFNVYLTRRLEKAIKKWAMGLLPKEEGVDSDWHERIQAQQRGRNSTITEIRKKIKEG